MRIFKTKWFARFELDKYQKLAQIYLRLTEAGITKALNEGELTEVI